MSANPIVSPTIYNQNFNGYNGAFPGYGGRGGCASGACGKPNICTPPGACAPGPFTPGAPPCPPTCLPACPPRPRPLDCDPCDPIGKRFDPCPLKSFCDPSLANTCQPTPIIDPCAPRRVITTFKVNYLVANRGNTSSSGGNMVSLSANQIRAAHLDPQLISPWGIVIYNNELWVATGGTDVINNYDMYGNKLQGNVLLRDAAHNPSFPTGIIVNCGTGFNVSSGVTTKPALFLVCSEHGTVQGYNPFVNVDLAYVVLNQQLTGEVAVYRGIAVVNTVMYLADFFQGHIDVFDGSYNRLLGFHFVDNDTSDPIPIDFAPNNIVHIGCYLYILYARRDANLPLNDIDGPGNGYISVFNFDGSFVRRFASRGVLNSPWAMIPAPCECGFPPGSFLVSNNGDGRINAFDCDGKFIGPLLNQAGLPVELDGLYGMAPHYTEFTTIFFAASPDENVDGYVGSLTFSQRLVV